MPGVGQPTNSDFEISFADLAHAQLRDKAPALLDHLLGFQVIDQNDEQTHGVGVLGFRLGKQTLFVPSFFLNGELKQNLIYIKDQDIFVPLQDNWVSYLINRRPLRMGSAESRTEQELGVLPPDMSALSNTIGAGGNAAPMFNTRQASWEPWTDGVERMFARLEGRYSKLDDLPTFLKKTANYGTSQILARTMRNQHDFANEVLKFYPIGELLHKPAACSKKKTKKRKKKAYVAPSLSPVLHDTSKYASDNDSDNVSVLRGVKAASHIWLGDEDRAALLRGELVVKDARDNTNDVYEADNTALQNPTITGVYDLVTTSGKSRRVLVIVGPKALGKGYARAALVVDKKSKNFKYWWPESLYCKQLQEADITPESYFSEATKSVKSMSPGSLYTIMSPNGDGTVAFRVKQKVNDGKGVVEYFVEPVINDPGLKPTNNRQATISDEEASQFGSGASQPFIGDIKLDTNDDSASDSKPEERIFQCLNHIVVLSGERGLRVVNNTLFVGDNAKAIELKQGDQLDTWTTNDPASLVDVELNLLKAGAQQFTILNKAGSYHVNGVGPFDRIDLITALIKNAGLKGDDAVAVVDGVKNEQRKKFLVKNNIGYAPPFPEPAMGYDDYAGVMEQYPQDDVMPIPTDVDQNLQAYLGKPERQQVMEAAQSGQKDIFDTSAIASLVHTADSDDLITQYLSDMILGMDRVNRILFMFYWLNEQFRDRYGQENMPELEDHLKNVSKSLGDLILFLKQQRVEGSPAYDSMEVELGIK